MKALTILQPFAYLVVAGRKDIENRTWPTHYRGPMLIHAGKSDRYVRDSTLMDYLAELVGMKTIDLEDRLVYGAIVGRVALTSCATIAEVGIKTWAEGPWCWLLSEPHEMERPVPWRGRQGLFDIPVEAFSTLRDFAQQEGLIDG